MTAGGDLSSVAHNVQCTMFVVRCACMLTTCMLTKHCSPLLSSLEYVNFAFLTEYDGSMAVQKGHLMKIQ